jgi:hypothetical protein
MSASQPITVAITSSHSNSAIEVGCHPPRRMSLTAESRAVFSRAAPDSDRRGNGALPGRTRRPAEAGLARIDTPSACYLIVSFRVLSSGACLTIVIL